MKCLFRLGDDLIGLCHLKLITHTHTHTDRHYTILLHCLAILCCAIPAICFCVLLLWSLVSLSRGHKLFSANFFLLFVCLMVLGIKKWAFRWDIHFYLAHFNLFSFVFSMLKCIRLKHDSQHKKFHNKIWQDFTDTCWLRFWFARILNRFSILFTFSEFEFSYS